MLSASVYCTLEESHRLEILSDIGKSKDFRVHGRTGELRPCALKTYISESSILHLFPVLRLAGMCDSNKTFYAILNDDLRKILKIENWFSIINLFQGA